MSSPSRAPLAPAVFVTGKGGVGKSTVAAGLAALSARSGDGGAALVEFGDGEAGQRALSRAPGHGVEHVVVRWDEAVARAIQPMLGGSRAASRLFVGNFAIKRVLGATPAVREIALLEAVRQLVEERPGKRVIVDMPATGHGVAWLKVPSQIQAMRSVGPFDDLNARIAEELLAPERCSVVIVTLPERLVVQETLELVQALRDEVGLDAARLVVNRVPAQLPDAALQDARALLEARGDTDTDALERFITVLEQRRDAHDEAIDSLSELLVRDIQPLLLPDTPTDPGLGAVVAWLEHGGML